MNRLLLFTLLLVACKQKPVEQLPTTAEKEVVEQDTILVSDIHRTDSHSLWIWEYKHPYVEGYIINQDYVIYQEENTRKIIKPDMASFAILESGLAKDKNGIYYQGDLIKIDTTGFGVVGVISHYDKQSDYYWKEPIWRTYKQAFRGTKPIAISDPATFESVTNCYFKDKNYLYYYDQKVEGADVATLQKESIDGEFVSDKNNTYYQGKPFIYKGERVQLVTNNTYKTEQVQLITANIYKTTTHVLRYNAGYDDKEKEKAEDYFVELPDYFDIPTLKRLNDSYLIDKNHLYYDENTYPLRDKDLRMPIPKENLSKIKLFEVFVTDGDKLYRGKELLSGYDVATFGIVPGHYYYQYDKNGIYNWRKKLPFRYTKRPEYGKNLFYIDEKNLFIYEDQAYYRDSGDSIYIKDLSSQQIEILKQGKTSLKDLLPPHKEPPQKKEKYDYNLYKVDGHIYIGEELQKDIDAATFQYITGYFYKDKNHVYYYDRWRGKEAHFLIVEGYDIATLRGDPNGFMMDKDYYYYGTTRLFKNKNVELLAVYTGYRMGCSQDRTPTTDYYLFKNDQGYWLAELGDENVIRFLGTELKMSELKND